MPNGKTLSKLAVIAPFLLGAALHLSALFKVFAGLPIVFVHLRYGRLAGIACAIVNLALVWLVSGRGDAAWFFVFGVVLGTALAESVKLKLKVEWSVLLSVLMMLSASGLLLLSYAHKVKQNPVGLVKSYVGAEVDEFVHNAEKYKSTAAMSSQDLEKVLVDPEVTKKNILEVLPSVTVISLLLLVVANVLLMVKLDLAQVRKKFGISLGFFKKWKSPDHMVWPTLAAGFCLVIEVPVVSDVALSVFRVLMAVYAIQGIAIISALFDSWGIKGFLRPLGYVLAVTFLLPLVISLGFFDLWFDFREKFRATSTKSTKK